jgi:hypothetical protein
MFGQHTRVNPLELRRQLLVAESKLDRAQLSEAGFIKSSMGEIHHAARKVFLFKLNCYEKKQNLTSWRAG